MKKIAVIIFVSLLGVMACKKKDKNESFVVNVPDISMEVLGPQIISVSVGGSFVDTYGADYHNEYGGIEHVPNATSSDLDLNNPGFYAMTYSAKSKYGYIAKANRLVLVSSAPVAEDFSGVYARTSNSQTVTVTKEGPGLYKIDNVGGVANNPDFIFDVYFGKVDASSTVAVPTQICPIDGSDLTCTNARLYVLGTDTILEWKVDNSSNFGTSLRKFIKQ